MIQIRLSAREPDELYLAERALSSYFQIQSRKQTKKDQKEHIKVYILATKKPIK